VQTIPLANLVRNTASANHYARVRLKGKLIWKSLKTGRLAILTTYLHRLDARRSLGFAQSQLAESDQAVAADVLRRAKSKVQIQS
jgi:hypothetical protein